MSNFLFGSYLLCDYPDLVSDTFLSLGTALGYAVMRKDRAPSIIQVVDGYY